MSRVRYEEGRSRHAATLAVLEGRSRVLGTARLVVVAAALGVIGGIVWGGLAAVAWAGLGALVLGFVGLVGVHARVHEASERARAGLRFHERGLARLALDWDKLPTSSERFRRPDHPFTGDLDVFGRASLMQIVDATVTRFGEERLAFFLSLDGSADGSARWPDDVLARQEAARELASRFAFREELAIAGGVLAGERPDPAPLVTWAEAREAPPSGFLRMLPVIAWLQPAIVVAIAAIGPSLGLSAQVVASLGALALAFGIGVGARLTPMLEAVSNRESSVTRWRDMMRAIEREDVQSPLLKGLRAALAGASSGGSGSDGATQELARLERIVGFTDARRNEVFRFFIGPLLMWDAHCAMALARWRARAGSRLRVWLETLAEAEAIASLGAFAFEHPEFAWPELSPEPMLQATSLGHPLIPADRRVSNDVRLPSAGRALVITGSNMSGKSTLLRAMGTNVVLARAGAPVCARSLRVGPLRPATSMRIADSLEQGVSHFYAELRRLKRVIDWAHEAGAAPVLFLLDEILHGTNSRERIIGACAVVRELVSLGALGAVSTHDLGITALERELPERVENAHFEEQVQGDEMTFDYVLRPGIVQSSNALRLMRA
ncbi:MAG TPA: DNA mismatch repair protein MutS, partial [Polyangiaceae bacterium]|nr:DNA mismatch repair protein MutS [Polyangiaceae bacterium]